MNLFLYIYIYIYIHLQSILRFAISANNAFLPGGAGGIPAGALAEVLLILVFDGVDIEDDDVVEDCFVLAVLCSCCWDFDWIEEDSPSVFDTVKALDCGCDWPWDVIGGGGL